MATSKLLLAEMDDTPKQISFANFAGDFNPTAGNDYRKGVDTEVELVMLNWANGAYIQSAKFDLGAVFAERYTCIIIPEMQVAAATDGSAIHAWASESSSDTPATANLGGASGAAAAYTGYSADAATAVEQLRVIGSGLLTDDAVDSVQGIYVGDFYPGNRYGSLILLNSTGVTICDTDDIEAHVILSPVIPQGQAL